MRKASIFLWSVLIATQAQVFSQSTETTLHNFAGGNDGADPVADLLYVSASATVYGTTNKGGGSAVCTKGCGTVFSIQSDGSGYVVAYHFQGGENDGANPQAGLVMDASGNLWGTTSNGGAHNLGTIFKLSSIGGGMFQKSFLYSFAGYPSDGAHPLSKLVLDSSGNLYGTTFEGGAENKGTVFELEASGTEVVLYSFTGRNGLLPRAGVVFDANGNLWGTTSKGGMTATGAVSTQGTVFGLTEVEGVWGESFLYSFRGLPDGDGANPYGAVTLDSAGDVFGTTKAGGAGCTFSAGGCGVVFELSATEGYSESLLYSFTGTADGAAPVDDLTLALDESGFAYLFGTASEAGTVGGTCPATGCGTAFEVCSPGSSCGGANDWSESTLFDFGGRNGGRTPLAGMVVFEPLSSGDSRQGPLYGGKGQCTSGCTLPISGGGTSGKGTLDELSGGGG